METAPRLDSCGPAARSLQRRGKGGPPRALAAACPKSWRRETLWIEESVSHWGRESERERGGSTRPAWACRRWVELRATVSRSQT